MIVIRCTFIFYFMEWKACTNAQCKLKVLKEPVFGRSVFFLFDKIMECVIIGLNEMINFKEINCIYRDKFIEFFKRFFLL